MLAPLHLCESAAVFSRALPHLSVALALLQAEDELEQRAPGAFAGCAELAGRAGAVVIALESLGWRALARRILRGGRHLLARLEGR